jgi:hypothetical protein
MTPEFGIQASVSSAVSRAVRVMTCAKPACGRARRRPMKDSARITSVDA